MSLRELMDLSGGPYQGFGAASEGLLFVSSVVGVLIGAGDPDAGGTGVAGAGAAGAGAVVAGAVGARGLDTVFLCFGVSGSTKGPFWPHPTTSPARHTGIHRRTIFIVRVYRVPRRGSLTGTSNAGSRSETAVHTLERC